MHVLHEIIGGVCLSGGDLVQGAKHGFIHGSGVVEEDANNLFHELKLIWISHWWGIVDVLVLWAYLTGWYTSGELVFSLFLRGLVHLPCGYFFIINR